MYPHIYIAISIIFTVQYIQLSRNKITEGFWDRLFPLGYIVCVEKYTSSAVYTYLSV